MPYQVAQVLLPEIGRLSMSEQGGWVEACLKQNRVGYSDADIQVDGAGLRDGLRGVAALLEMRGVAEGSRIVVEAESSVRGVLGLLGSACHGISIPWDGTSEMALPPDVAAVLRVTSAPVPARWDGIPTISLPQAADLLAPGPDGSRRLGSPTILLRTSGTSGDPKWVQLDDRSWRCAGAIVGDALSLGADDMGLCLMPLSHGHGISTGIFAPLTSGGRMAFTDFRSLAGLRWGLRSDASWYSASPTVHQTLLRLRAEVPGLFTEFRPRVVRSTSDALPAHVQVDLEEAFGCPVIEAYALTEAPGAVASMSLKTSRGSRSYAVLPQVAIRICRDDESEVGAGETGHIQVRGDNVMAGYLDASAGALVPHEGWHGTGDLGYWDAKDNLVIAGRRTEAIKRDGLTLIPADLEDRLSTIPLMEEAMVCSLPGGERGDSLGIAVVSKDGSVSISALRQLVDAVLPQHCRPYQLMRLDELPRTALGKPSRRGLRELMTGPRVETKEDQ